MNNFTKAKIIRTIIGRWLYNKLQMLLKQPQLYYLPKKNSPKTELQMFDKDTKYVVFIIDGRTVHGGLSDRLRGLFSVYEYAKYSGRTFKIAWNTPFMLTDYLLPATFDWYVNNAELPYNRKDVSVKFFNSYSDVNNDRMAYFRLLDTKKRLLYVYSNVTISENNYAEYFNELFRPTIRLTKLLDDCNRQINGKYVSISFRFIGLLGDFKDDSFYGKLETEEEIETYIQKCINAIKKVRNLHLEVDKVLVTSDSAKFLERLYDCQYVYIAPGNIVHMDKTDNTNHLKTFLDMLLISHAEQCYCYGYGRMFKATKFAKTAALISGKELITLPEER